MAVEKVLTAGLKRSKMTQIHFFSLMEELRRLVETAGGIVVQEYTQSRPHPDPATLLGKGKIMELGEECKRLGVKTIVFDTGPIISLTMNNLLGILEPLKKAAKARFDYETRQRAMF